MAEAEDETTKPAYAGEKKSTNLVSIASAKSAKSFQRAADAGKSPTEEVIGRIDLEDILSARLTQMQGVLLAIRNTYDEDEGEHPLPGEHMQNALWALDELLDQAEDARSKLGRK